VNHTVTINIFIFETKMSLIRCSSLEVTVADDEWQRCWRLFTTGTMTPSMLYSC